MAALARSGSSITRPFAAPRVCVKSPVGQLKHAQHSRRERLVARAADTGMAPELKAAIDELISTNKIVVFMKRAPRARTPLNLRRVRRLATQGTKQFPQCGFSNTVVQILREVGAPFEAVNVLEAEAIRSGMKEYSAWPTFPQARGPAGGPQRTEGRAGGPQHTEGPAASLLAGVRTSRLGAGAGDHQ
ncbi:Monothiol glutaredoxin-S7 [Monoraphidium neglectum]|uniref:Monothiol glutaredoxin-S7 n=1 Tax=Monoraphidium neglectum TaxID=145388 RepID=A0A0D2MQ36_9CHLO|nr:Monothiol glutaredoxin-S7 [Monoraphidium neglectum]KIZ04775.1 Monothiol glutaredoxin-S7 [Monoraphidium neglectum]|eukprot:XP_013903794.1 Monothiol glutaredoxin-S7 [Monoraphidium neglectum]